MLSFCQSIQGSVTASGSHDFMGPYSRVPYDVELAKETAEQIRQALNLPEQARDEVLKAYLCSFDRTGIDYIDAEISTLTLRFGLVGETATDKGMTIPTKPADFKFVGHHCPPIMQTGQLVYRSFRVKAIGDMQPGKTGITYTWRKKSDGAIGKLYRFINPPKKPVSFTPIAVKPGREISIPVGIQTPVRSGCYELTLEGFGASSNPTLTIPVAIGDIASRPKVGPPPTSYGEDHEIAIEMLADYLKGRPVQALLEVASGVNPHLFPFAEMGHTIVASDVCSNQMQLGAVYAKYMWPESARQNVRFASFDALNPPYDPGQFDGIAMFAALHHFPNPTAFLKALSGQLKPGGFLGVFCEPCDPLTASKSEAYIRDLEAGVNEQVFSIEEYRHIFKMAGFTEEAIRIDAGSLKAILTRS